MNAKKLQHILIDKDVSQKKLAEVAGVSQAFISIVLAGKKDPSIVVLKRITDYLEIPVDEVL